MKFIHLPSDEGIEFGRYTEYISPLVLNFPEHIRDLVSQPRYYDLNSPETLHDAKIDAIRLIETPGILETQSPSELDIHIHLKGAYCKSHLHYKNVSRYKITGNNNEGYFDSFHSDLFTHEFRIEPNGEFLHEILFVTSSSIEIVFGDLTLSQEPY